MDERVDLTTLDLTAEQRELLVASILTRAAAELERRANAVSPIYVLYAWTRPALAAAAVLALLCLSVLLRDDSGGQQQALGLTEALNVPAPASAWLVGDRSPTVEDLILAMEESR